MSGGTALFSFLRRTRSNECVGISFQDNGISLAHSGFTDGVIELRHVAFRPLSIAEERAAALKEMIGEASLKGLPAVFVLQPGQYAMLQVESPEVPDDELKNAVRWRIKDLIDFHIDDAIIESVPLPQGNRPGAPQMMYALAMRTSAVQSIVSTLLAAGLQIRAVDVTELALRNMTFASADENRATALLYLSEYFSLIEICINGTLYLSRQINMDFSHLQADAADNRMELMDMLSLEVQRSLDYYESQFANGAASIINMVSQVPVSLEQFQEVAGSYLTVPVEGLPALQNMRGVEQFDEQLVARSLPAIGASIREFAWNA